MNASVEEFLANYGPEVRKPSLKLRDLVFKLVPDANEIAYTGWGEYSV